MKILLIGKTGQIGKEIDNIGRLKKHNIKSLDRKELNILDFLKVKNILDYFSPEIVINTTAYHVVEECEKYPQKAFAVNSLAVKNLAILCNEREINLVHFSTAWVFDGQKQGPYLENDICNPLQIYGLSKFAGEILCQNNNKNTVIIRTCGVFGGKKGSRSKKGNFILNLLRAARTKRSLEVSSEQMTSITSAKDLALATIQLLGKKPNSGIYHLVNNGICSWIEVAKKIVELKNLKLNIIPIDREGNFKEVRVPINSSLKNKKAKDLGITLPPWENALRRYLESL